MSCKCAKWVNENQGWECSITGLECAFKFPSSKECAEEYGEGPDAVTEEESDGTVKIEHGVIASLLIKIDDLRKEIEKADENIDKVFRKILMQCNESLVYDNLEDLRDGLTEIKRTCEKIMAERSSAK